MFVYLFPFFAPKVLATLGGEKVSQLRPSKGHMSCVLNISGRKILRTFLNPQAKPAVKKKKNIFPVHLSSLPVPFPPLPAPQEVLKQEVITSHLLGILAKVL